MMCRQMAVVAGQLEPCDFPSLESCQKRFLWSHKEVDLAPRPVVGLVLQVGSAGKFSQALGFRKTGSFFFIFSFSRQVHVLQSQRRIEVTRDLCNLNLLTKLMVLLRQILFNLAITAFAEAVLMRTSAEQVPFLQRVTPRYLKRITCSNL